MDKTYLLGMIRSEIHQEYMKTSIELSCRRSSRGLKYSKICVWCELQRSASSLSDSLLARHIPAPR